VNAVGFKGLREVNRQVMAPTMIAATVRIKQAGGSFKFFAVMARI
jgi:hypothetical protein|tara:strand:+ start:103 stop:237 length:135 start_codon:yes stop_codon:yes gene_type:complete